MSKNKSILLVDDDVTSNFISELVIKRLSVFNSVKSVKNGKEALELILNNCVHEYKENCPQIIFLDLHMPVMDGFSFLEHLSLQMPNYVQVFKIFILTSSNNPMDMEMSDKYKIDGYIIKPLSSEKVKELIC